VGIGKDFGYTPEPNLHVGQSPFVDSDTASGANLVLHQFSFTSRFSPDALQPLRRDLYRDPATLLSMQEAWEAAVESWREEFDAWFSHPPSVSLSENEATRQREYASTAFPIHASKNPVR